MTYTPFFIEYCLKFTGKNQRVTGSCRSELFSDIEQHSHQQVASRSPGAPAKADNNCELKKKDTLSIKKQ